MASSDPKPSEVSVNTKRRRSQSLEPLENGREANSNDNKKPRLGGVWKNLDLVLSLQRKDMPLPRKIGLAFDFVSSEGDCCDRRVERVQKSRLVSFVGNWIQNVLVSSDNSKKGSETSDSCLDYRCWVILRFCLEYSIAVSPNLLRGVTQVARHALLEIDDGSSFVGEESAEYFKQVLECLSLLLSSNGRAFYNATVELWISLAVEIVNLVRKVFTDDICGSAGGQAFLRLSVCLLEQFAIFLRFYPNPKNIFRAFVDRLLDPLLELLVLLHSPANPSNNEQLGSLLQIVEDVLSNGLFHPAHISGFFSLKSLNIKLEAREFTGIKESYHRHLLQRFKGIKAENKAVLLGGFGYLLQLFVSRVKNRRGTSLASKGTADYVSGKNSEASEEAQETNCSLFEVFVQFMEPLLLECKECAQIGFSEAGEIKLLETHCMLKSVNETLTIFIQEKIYVRTEDNSEGSHYKFLQDIYDTVISIAEEVYKFWLSTLHADDASIKKMLPLIAKEIFVAVGYFLEIEYKVVGDDIIKLWLMIFSFLAVNLSSEDTKPSSLLVTEILNLGSLVINIFSELRQVNYPIFTLSKAVRLFILAADADANADAARYSSFIASSPLSSQMYLESLAKLLCSQVLQNAIFSSIKSMPDRQTSACIEELKVEVTETLKWMRSCSFVDESSDSCEKIISSRTVLDFDLQTKLLGRVFSELYINILDSLTVTATNSILVGNSVENLMKEIRPSFSCLLQNQSDIYEFVFSLTGTSRSNHEISECGKHRTSLSVSWAFIFFFRLYTSCRSLYQQVISLMPPDSARKASELMGNLFDYSCGMKWSNKPSVVDGGYFSWIVKPSCTLLDVIQRLSETVLTRSYAGYAPLIYVLHIMVLQRLSDLNRQIKAFSFLQEGEERQFKKHGDPNRRKASKTWKRLLAASRLEAAGLTNFMTDYMRLLFSEQKWSIRTDKTLFPLTKGAWDLVVSSLNKISLPIGIWWLLCRNIDIWCLHGSKKDLKDFFSHLLRQSLECESTRRDAKENIESNQFTKEVTLRNISLGLLHDTVLYDQTVLSKHFMPRFCHAVKRSFSPVVNYAYAAGVDLNSLPNWSEILSVLDKGHVVDTDGHTKQVQTSPSESDLVTKNDKLSLLSFETRLRTCESLLSLLCKIPGVHVNAKSFSLCVTYILHLERLAVSNLLSHAESFICNPFELFRLFASCRKALSYLIMTYKEGNQELMLFSVFSTMFGDSSSIIWLLKSVHELVGLPHAVFGEFSDQVKNMIPPLIDHTSNIFSTVSNGLICHAIAFLKNNEELIELSLHDDPERKGALDKGDQQSDISKYYAAWKNVELIAQTLENQTRRLPVTVKGRMRAIKLGSCFDILCWNKILSTVSCLQGFLWGLVLALDSICKDYSAGNLQSSKLLDWYASKLGSYISIFENFVDICMYILLVGSTQGAVDVRSFHSLQDLDSDNGSMNLDSLMDRLVKCFSCQVEHVPDNHPKMRKQDKRTTRPALNHNDDSTSQSECECINLFRFEKERPSVHASCTDDIFSELHNIDFSDQQHLNVSLLKNLLQGENPLIALTLKELFIASAAILKLRCLLSFHRNLTLQKCSSHLGSYSMGILVRVSHIILQEMAERSGWPDAFSFVWIDGILRYLEVVGSYFSLADPNLSKEVYSQVINSHLKAIGKCISIQGQIATLSSHETGSNTKTLWIQRGSDHPTDQNFDHRQCNINAFKSRLRMSLSTFIGRPLKLHMTIAIQAIERALIGVQQGCQAIYNINTGNIDGGEVSSVVAAGIDCFNLILESHSGYEHVLKKSIPSLVGSLLNIVLHLQSPIIFYIEKSPKRMREFHPDAGAVILMCVEVLTTVVGRHSFQMNICHVSQCLHLPVVLFRYFHQLKASRLEGHSSVSYCSQDTRTLTDVHQYIVDRRLSVDLYAACCKLIWITLKHRIREIEQCIALIEDSVTTLLNCLELVDSHFRKEGCFSWEVQEALKCASFFRRIYEEIRQQKDVLGRHSLYFLSSYISIYSGYGPLQRGIKREIDEALRPGVYSLIDICTSTDLQQLHTVLGEGPCRSTLANLLHDYRLHFQYKGKI